MWDMMAGGDAALIEERQRGSVEEARARIFSINGVVVVASSACSWSGPLGPRLWAVCVIFSSIVCSLLGYQQGSSRHPRWVANGSVRACLSASKNKGGLALVIFEHHILDLLHIGLLNLDVDEFWSPSLRFLVVWRMAPLDI
jgi:hypothetical protein